MTEQKAPRSTPVVAFGNQKGGVTKTTTVVNVAAALSEMGKRVLVWDLDTNPSSTRLFGIPEGVNVLGTFEVLTQAEEASDVIVSPGELEDMTLPENVELIPSHTKMQTLEKVLAGQEDDVFTTPNPDLLSDALSQIADQYDFVFLDTAPSMTPATKAAYLAASHFVLTAIPEPLAMESLVTAIRFMQAAKKAGNKNLQLMGVVLSQIPGRTTRLAKTLIAEAEEQFTGEFQSPYKTTISTSTTVPTAQKERKTIVQAAPDHKVAEQYRALAREFLARFEAFERASEPEGRPLTAPAPSVKEGVANG